MKRRPDRLERWLWRLVAAAAVLSLIGWFNPPSSMPLMCKIWG